MLLGLFIFCGLVALWVYFFSPGWRCQAGFKNVAIGFATVKVATPSVTVP
jgi:hypothetical protein